MVDLDELGRLLKHATPDPWECDQFYPHITSGKGSQKILVATVATNTFWDQGRYNKQLIIALHNAAEELIRDARKWWEYEADMRRATNVEAEQS